MTTSAKRTEALSHIQNGASNILINAGGLNESYGQSEVQGHTDSQWESGNQNSGFVIP